MTTFENKCLILSNLWLNYRNDEQFENFIAYNDLGLPLAYAISEGIVENTELATKFIDEAYDLLLMLVGAEDVGWENFDDMIG